jgi:hypothetical protein
MGHTPSHRGTSARPIDRSIDRRRRRGRGRGRRRAQVDADLEEGDRRDASDDDDEDDDENDDDDDDDDDDDPRGDDDDVRDVGGTNDEWRSARWRSRRTRRRRRDDDAWVFAVRRWEDLRRRGRGSKERARVRVTDVRTRGD